MSLELLKGYFYNSDGDLIQWYQGYGDLENLEFQQNGGNFYVNFRPKFVKWPIVG